jgi:hypothetical protein
MYAVDICRYIHPYWLVDVSKYIQLAGRYFKIYTPLLANRYFQKYTPLLAGRYLQIYILPYWLVVANIYTLSG